MFNHIMYPSPQVPTQPVVVSRFLDYKITVTIITYTIRKKTSNSKNSNSTVTSKGCWLWYIHFFSAMLRFAYRSNALAFASLSISKASLRSSCLSFGRRPISKLKNYNFSSRTSSLVRGAFREEVSLTLYFDKITSKSFTNITSTHNFLCSPKPIIKS